MSATKHWTLEEVLAVYNSPLLELVYKAATVHREHHNPREVQISTLLSIKTGGCPKIVATAHKRLVTIRILKPMTSCL